MKLSKLLAKAMDLFVYLPPDAAQTNCPALMSPGVLKASIFVGALYVVYLLDRSSARQNDGVGFIQRWVDRIVADGADPRLHSAGIEEARQRTKAHFETERQPRYRLMYPE